MDHCHLVSLSLFAADFTHLNDVQRYKSLQDFFSFVKKNSTPKYAVFFSFTLLFSRGKGKKMAIFARRSFIWCNRKSFFHVYAEQCNFSNFCMSKKNDRNMIFLFFLAFLLLLFSLGEHWCCKWDEGCKIKESFRRDLSLFYAHKKPSAKKRKKNIATCLSRLEMNIFSEICFIALSSQWGKVDNRENKRAVSTVEYLSRIDQR